MRRAFGVITTIKIPMTPELSPSARIIVHCTVNGNEVVADSLLIDPEDKLSNEVTRIYTRSRNLIIITITTLLLLLLIVIEVIVIIIIMIMIIIIIIILMIIIITIFCLTCLAVFLKNSIALNSCKKGM